MSSILSCFLFVGEKEREFERSLAASFFVFNLEVLLRIVPVILLVEKTLKFCTTFLFVLYSFINKETLKYKLL